MRIEDRSIPEIARSLELLLQALFSTAQDPLAIKLIAAVRSLPLRFTRGNSQVPCLLKLIPWSQKKLKHVPHVLAEWSETVRAELIAATSQSPQRPTNWTRPAEIKGSSTHDKQLNDFLADPASETLTIAAAEQMRYVILSTVSEHRCDVTHRLEKKGSPYRLVFTKTLSSYERAVKQHENDLKMLTALDRVTP